MEANARLDAMLKAATESDVLTLKMMPHVEMPATGPELKPASTLTGPVVVESDLSLEDSIRMKSEILGALTGLPPEDITKRVRDGVDEDLRVKNLRSVQNGQKPRRLRSRHLQNHVRRSRCRPTTDTEPRHRGWVHSHGTGRLGVDRPRPRPGLWR